MTVLVSALVVMGFTRQLDAVHAATAAGPEVEHDAVVFVLLVKLLALQGNT